MGLGDLFSQWEAAGIFQYALPFLLIFALVLGLLTKLNIFTTKEGKANKGVNAMIALAVSFMALQFNMVSSFFASLFPRLGVALAVILVTLIFTGLFTDPESKITKWILYAEILVTTILVLSVPLKVLGFNLNYNEFFIKNWGNILLVLIFLALMFWVISGGKKSSSKGGAPPQTSMG